MWVEEEDLAFRCSRCRRRFSEERSTARMILGEALRFNLGFDCGREFFEDERVEVEDVLDIDDNERAKTNKKKKQLILIQQFF